jgi:hypothetical protein
MGDMALHLRSSSMLIRDVPMLMALAAIVSSVAALIWSVRRKAD